MSNPIESELDVVAVTTHGSATSFDFVETDTEIVVEDVDDFDEGDQVDIDGEVYGVASVDPETLTLGLSEALRADVPTSTPVSALSATGQLSQTWEAYVYLDGSDEPVPALIEGDWISKFREGDAQKGMAVTVVEDGDGYRVVGTPESPPDESGEWTDPTTVPDSEPTAPPASSPTPFVFAGPAAAMVAWEPVLERSTLIDLHVTTTTDGEPPTTDPDASTLWGEGVTPIQLVSTLVDGTAMPVTSDAYFALVARNAVDSAPPSAWVPGRAGVIPPEMLVLVVGTLLANDVLAESLRANGIQVGNANWDQEAFTLPGLVADFLENTLSITAVATLLQATITNLRLIGLNSIEGRGVLAGGVTAPAVAPIGDTYWQHDDASIETEAADGITIPRGLFDASTEWVFTTSVFGGNTWSLNKTTGARFILGALPADWSPLGGAVKVGASWYVLATNGPEWRVYVYNSSWTLTGNFSFAATSVVGDSAALATNGTGLFIAYRHVSTGVLRVSRYGTDGVFQRYDTLTASPSGASGKVRGLYVGSADLGASSFVVALPNEIRVYTNGGGSSGATQTRNTAKEWRAANSEEILGLSWDGTRFHTLSPSGKVWHYARRPDAETRTLTHSFYKSTVTTRETEPGASRSATFRAREWPRIQVDPPNNGGGPNDPDSVRIYIDNHRQPDLGPGVIEAIYDTLDLTGAAGQTSNGFASLDASIGQIESTQSDSAGPLSKIAGAGQPRLAKLVQSGSEVLTPTALNTAVTVDVTFPVPFDEVPEVVTDPITGAPHQVFSSPSNITATGCRLNLVRTSGLTATRVQWTATAAN